MKAVAQTIGVSRSQLYARAQGKSKPRHAYHKADDAVLLPRIKRLVKERPTSGYRRITAHLNKELRLAGLAQLNHKRVYRIMKQNQLLLARKYQTRPEYVHDGKVIVMRSNLRWCGDGFEFACWNGEIIRAAFIMDAHDREVMTWRAVHGSGISGADVCDMMLEAVEARFGNLKAPDSIEMLTDNGSAYKAKDTQKFAKQLGLRPCFTPIASPQSNGMSEAFVRTFKRDYVEVNPLPDAKTVLGLIGTWFEDYNNNHPHSGLRMLSPRDYIKSQNKTA